MTSQSIGRRSLFRGRVVDEPTTRCHSGFVSELTARHVGIWGTDGVMTRYSRSLVFVDQRAEVGVCVVVHHDVHDKPEALIVLGMYEQVRIDAAKRAVTMVRTAQPVAFAPQISMLLRQRHQRRWVGSDDLFTRTRYEYAELSIHRSATAAAEYRLLELIEST